MAAITIAEKMRAEIIKTKDARLIKIWNTVRTERIAELKRWQHPACLAEAERLRAEMIEGE